MTVPAGKVLTMGPNGTAVWSDGMPGPQGSQGVQGPPGNQGQTGGIGATGGQGATGPVGLTGGTGAPGPVGSITTQLDTYSTAGTFSWTPPSGLLWAEIIVQGAGGGGGSGRRGAAGTLRGGGGGGSGGGFVYYKLLASDIGVSAATIVVGAGGAGGAAVGADDTDGAPGGTGAVSRFTPSGRSPYEYGAGGGNGAGGTSAAGGVGGLNNVVGAMPGAAGGNGTTAPGSWNTGAASSNGVSYIDAAIGAPGGGGITTGNAAQNGGQGLTRPNTSGYTAINGGAGGTAGVAGTDASLANLIQGWPMSPGHVGSGGGAGTAGVGGKGGNGIRGAGGAGGGASTNTFASGAGGNGGDGFVAILSYKLLAVASDFGFGWTTDPRTGSLGNSVITANRTVYLRYRGPTIAINKVTMKIGAQSGNVAVAAYVNTGTARAARPGAQLATTGSVACPAVGDAVFTFPGPANMKDGDWLAIAADNATASFAVSGATGTVTALGQGLAQFQDIYPPPATAAPSATQAVYSFIMIAET